MSEPREELTESKNRNIVEGYIAFQGIEEQYNDIEEEINLTYNQVTNILTVLETEIEERKDNADFEDSKELLDGEKEELNYNPVERTKWFLANEMHEIEEEEDFKEYWSVYSIFLEGFRESKVDLTSYT